MSESRLEIQAGEIEIPAEICCNCATMDGVGRVESELKLTRFLGMGGSEYTYTWGLPYCPDCAVTANRNPIDKMHVAMVIGMCTVALFLAAIAGQTAIDRSLFAGNDFFVALAAATVLVGGFYAARQPQGGQTSYYRPIRILKLRQKFTSGEVTGIVLGFTNGAYMQRFRDANSRALAG